jgi:hypothetical protein
LISSSFFSRLFVTFGASRLGAMPSDGTNSVFRRRRSEKYVLFLLFLPVLALWMMMRSADVSSFDIPEAAFDVSHYLLEGLTTIASGNANSTDISDGLDIHASTITGYSDRASDERTRAHTGSQRTAKAVIAYAVSITACNNPRDLKDGAAVLKHSIHLSSIRNPNSTSKYDYHLVAFIHPNATRCESTLERLGYQIDIRDTPVDVTQIKNNSDMVRRVIKSGCCGEKEFLKLYSFTLLDYPVVVHLDLDTAILRPLDDLFDVMLLPANATKHIPAAMWTTNVTHPVNAFFTRDYPMINPGRKGVKTIGMQGGFFVVRPDLSVFDEFCSIIMSGQFYPGPGWGGPKLRYGGYFGAAQIQGLVPYFYGHFHPNTSIELNRCNYNQMADPPLDKKKGVCLTGEENCQDCRDTDVPDIYSVHYTLCQKPWWCPHTDAKWLNEEVWKGRQAELCMKLHHEWHRIRHDLEQTWQIAEPAKFAGYANHSANVTRDSFGHCQPGGGRFGYKYIQMELPPELKPL